MLCSLQVYISRHLLGHWASSSNVHNSTPILHRCYWIGIFWKVSTNLGADLLSIKDTCMYNVHHVFATVDSLSLSLFQPPSSRELLSLSPVPEALEGESEEETLRDKENSPTTTTSKTVIATNPVHRRLSPSTSSPSTTQPPMVAAASVGGSGHRMVQPTNSSTSTLGSQQSSTTDLNRKGNNKFRS